MDTYLSFSFCLFCFVLFYRPNVCVDFMNVVANSFDSSSSGSRVSILKGGGVLGSSPGSFIPNLDIEIVKFRILYTAL